MKLQGPPTQGHIVSNHVTRDLLLCALKIGMKTFRASLPLYILREEGRKWIFVKYTHLLWGVFSPSSHWIYLAPSIHLRQLPQSTLSCAHTRGKYHNRPWPVYTPEGGTAIHILFPAHTWGRYCHAYSPGKAPEEPFGSSHRFQSYRVQASFQIFLEEKQLTPSAPPRLGRGQSIGRLSGAQSPPQTHLLLEASCPPLSHTGLGEQLPLIFWHLVSPHIYLYAQLS